MDESQSNFAQSWFEFLQILQKRFWTIRTFLVITLLVTAAGTWLQTPIYRATASVLIDMESPNVLTVSSSWSGSDSSPGAKAEVGQVSYMTYADYYRTQLEIMSSRSIAEIVFHNLRLGERPEYVRAKDPVGLLLGKVEVEPIKQTRLAKIHVEDKDPETAARIANELAVVFALENLNKTSMAEAMTLKKNEFLKLQAKEAELSKRYKGKHPALVRLRTEMEQLEQSIERGAARRGSSGAFGAGDPSTGAGVASPEERLKQATLSGSLRPNNIRVQDLAQPPLKPVRPKKSLALLLGFVVGLVGGVGAALAQEMVDVSLRGPEDVEQGGKVALLGHVPKIEGLQGAASREFENACRFSDVESFSPAAEAYRSIRTTLLYAAPMNGARAVVFTSPGPGEGKTTTVSNLGVAIARGGAPILLVDADLRRGRLNEVFQLKRSPGLSEFLTGQAAFKEIVQETEIPGLHVVAGGNYPPYPAELIGSEPMRNFLQAASAKYERVFLDTPPILAVTDAVILAAMTKVVVGVAQSGKTPRQALDKLLKSCGDVGARMLGVVLNNVPVWGAPYYYKYSSASYPKYPSRKGADSGHSPTSKPV